MNNFTTRLLISFIFAPIILVIIFSGGWYFKLLLLFILLIGLYEISLINKIQIQAFILIFFSLFLYILYFLRIVENNFQNILICLLITWLSDTGGFAFGKIIGGKKIKIISPNKTYSGFLGAIFLPQILTIYLFNENFFFNKNIYFYILIIFFLSFSAIIGDLVFSYIKRLINIKDYSNLIPGHGGLFDRIDGLIFVTIIFYSLTKL